MNEIKRKRDLNPVVADDACRYSYQLATVLNVGKGSSPMPHKAPAPRATPGPTPNPAPASTPNSWKSERFAKDGTERPSRRWQLLIGVGPFWGQGLRVRSRGRLSRSGVKGVVCFLCSSGYGACGTLRCWSLFTCRSRHGLGWLKLERDRDHERHSGYRLLAARSIDRTNHWMIRLIQILHASNEASS